MKTRRIFATEQEIIELVSTDGQSALKIQLFRGDKGNLQVFAFSQPEANLSIDPSRADRAHIRQTDPEAE
jgi:hypothetical protein